MKDWCLQLENNKDNVNEMWPQASTLLFGYTPLLFLDQWQGYYGSSHESLLSVSIFQFQQKYNVKSSSHKLEKNRDFFLSVYIYVHHTTNIHRLAEHSLCLMNTALAFPLPLP